VRALNGLLKVLAMKTYSQLALFSYLAKAATNNGKRTYSLTEAPQTTPSPAQNVSYFVMCDVLVNDVGRLLRD